MFDTETQTLLTLNTKLITPTSSISATAVGTKIYLFGGRSSSQLDTISVFDTETEELLTLD